MLFLPSRLNTFQVRPFGFSLAGTPGFTEFVSSFLLWFGFFWLGRKELGIGCRERTPYNATQRASSIQTRARGVLLPTTLFYFRNPNTQQRKNDDASERNTGASCR